MRLFLKSLTPASPLPPSPLYKAPSPEPSSPPLLSPCAATSFPLRPEPNRPRPVLPRPPPCELRRGIGAALVSSAPRRRRLRDPQAPATIIPLSAERRHHRSPVVAEDSSAAASSRRPTVSTRNRTSTTIRRLRPLCLIPSDHPAANQFPKVTPFRVVVDPCSRKS